MLVLACKACVTNWLSKGSLKRCHQAASGLPDAVVDAVCELNGFEEREAQPPKASTNATAKGKAVFALRRKAGNSFFIETIE